MRVFVYDMETKEFSCGGKVMEVKSATIDLQRGERDTGFWRFDSGERTARFELRPPLPAEWPSWVAGAALLIVTDKDYHESIKGFVYKMDSRGQFEFIGASHWRAPEPRSLERRLTIVEELMEKIRAGLKTASGDYSADDDWED